jgi:hypothetical protein
MTRVIFARSALECGDLAPLFDEAPPRVVRYSVTSLHRINNRPYNKAGCNTGILPVRSTGHLRLVRRSKLEACAILQPLRLSYEKESAGRSYSPGAVLLSNNSNCFWRYLLRRVRERHHVSAAALTPVSNLHLYLKNVFWGDGGWGIGGKELVKIS